MQRTLLLLLLPLLLGCETDPDFLGMDYDASMARLERGDYSFLRDVDPRDFNSERLYGIEDGSGYYVGRIFERKGREQTAFRFHEMQFDSGVEPWAAESALRMVDLAHSRRERERALVAAETVSASTSRYARLALERADLLLSLDRAEEVYGLERYADELPDLHSRLALASLIDGKGERFSDDLRRALRDAASDEGLAKLESRLTSLREPNSTSRGAGSPDESVSIAREVPRAQYDYLAYRAAVADREWTTARHVLDSMHPGTDGVQFVSDGEELTVDNDSVFSRPGIADIRETYFRDGSPRAGAERLSALLDVAPTHIRHYMHESIGRLYRAVSDNRAAVGALRRAMDSSEDAGSYDDALYHYLHAAVSADPIGLVGELAGVLERANEPSRFDESLERLLANIVPARRWDALVRAHSAIREHGSSRSAAQYAVALAGAVRAGLVHLPAERNSGTDGLDELLQPAFEQRESPYYSIVASVMMDRELWALPGERDAERESVAGDDDLLVSGYMQYGLLAEAYRAVYEDDKRTGGAVTEQLAAELARSGQLLFSLRVANRLSRIDDLVVDRDLARLIYPLAYEEEMRAVVEEFDLPLYLFYGLVREESYFDAEIRSWVGATGLAQLMPATAMDVANRLGVSDYDLTDPETNLRFGARYLSDINRSLGNWLGSLAAYNAGQGRVRVWRANRGDLPSILFHEGIPLGETRDYIRKILVSAVNYRHLYDNGTVRDTVLDFFPDLF